MIFIGVLPLHPSTEDSCILSGGPLHTRMDGIAGLMAAWLAGWIGGLMDAWLAGWLDGLAD